MKIKIPAKTFLVGEYAVLSGETCLVISHDPCFEFGSQGKSLHEDSPAGKYLANHPELVHDITLKLTSQTETSSGGFGASSAEFLANWLLVNGKSLTPNWWRDCFADFKKLSLSGNPSGADLVSQILGGITEFSVKKIEAKRWDWIFKDLSLAIFKTGAKLNTHSHLLEIKTEDFEPLNVPLKKVLNSFQSQHKDEFISGVNDYRQCLRDLKLEAEFTTLILESIKLNPKVVAIKGCGAMGADSFLVIVRAVDANSVFAEIASKYKLIATDRQLFNGVQWGDLWS